MNPIALIRAMRPHQWSKNVFVLAALGFAWGDRQLADYHVEEHLPYVLFALAAFCLGSSAIYLVNDVMDVENDRQHPEKKNRPIAAGEVSVSAAIVASLVCAASAIALALAAGDGGVGVAVVVGAYMAMNLAYSIKLKHVVLVDAFCIAGGFLFRVKAGGIAAQADVSHWLALCTLFLALFLALNKRRAEITKLGDKSGTHRAILKEYTVEFLDQMVTVLAACTVVCYALYAVDPDTAAKFGEESHMIWTVPFVVFGVARYMFLVHTGRGGGSPTKIFLGADPWFTLNTIAWVVVTGAVVLRGY